MAQALAFPTKSEDPLFSHSCLLPNPEVIPGYFQITPPFSSKYKFEPNAASLTGEVHWLSVEIITLHPNLSTSEIPSVPKTYVFPSAVETDKGPAALPETAVSLLLLPTNTTRSPFVSNTAIVPLLNERSEAFISDLNMAKSEKGLAGIWDCPKISDS